MHPRVPAPPDLPQKANPFLPALPRRLPNLRAPRPLLQPVKANPCRLVPVKANPCRLVPVKASLFLPALPPRLPNLNPLAPLSLPAPRGQPAQALAKVKALPPLHLPPSPNPPAQAPVPPPRLAVQHPPVRLLHRQVTQINIQQLEIVTQINIKGGMIFRNCLPIKR